MHALCRGLAPERDFDDAVDLCWDHLVALVEHDERAVIDVGGVFFLIQPRRILQGTAWVAVKRVQEDLQA